MSGFDVVTVVSTEAEAEFLCSLLREGGVSCLQRQTNQAAGANEGFPGAGAHEVVVPGEDLSRARALLDLAQNSD
jgi:Putative prokaryotic signal transducing protein